MSRLDEIKARAEAATLGPWHAWDRGIGWEVHKGEECAPGGRSCDALNGEFRDTFTREDAEFIAAAREDVPWLIERIGELNGAICWDTTCLNCSSLLDSNYDQYMRAEIAEAEVERLTAERDALAAQVARVEALAEEWSTELDENRCPAHAFPRCDCHEGYHHAWGDLRAALAGPEADTSDVDVCSGDADCTSELHVHGCFADSAGPCTDPDEHQPTGQEAAPDAGHKCEPCYSRSECGQCGWQEQWCVTCSRQMCGCATETTNQEDQS